MGVPNQIDHRRAYEEQKAAGKLQQNPSNRHGHNEPIQPPKPRPKVAPKEDNRTLGEKLNLRPAPEPEVPPVAPEVEAPPAVEVDPPVADEVVVEPPPVEEPVEEPVVEEPVAEEPETEEDEEELI